MGEMATHEILWIISLIVLVLVFIANSKDDHRIWLVAVLLCINSIGPVIRSFLPVGVYIHQLFYLCQCTQYGLSC